MSLRARSLASRQQGFSLVELMIALLLGLLVVAGASSVLLSNKQSYKAGEALSRVQEGSRVGFELFARDVRGAALTGCGNSGRVANVITNAGTTWWANWDKAVIGYGGAGSSGADSNPALTTGTALSNHVSGTDSIVLIGADDITYSGAANADGTTAAPFKTSETATLRTGDVIIVCTAGGGAALQQATIAQITSVPAAGSYVTGASGATPGNCTTGLGFPTSCSSANIFTYPYVSTLISKLKSVSWYLGVNAQGTSSLYRMTLTSTNNPSPAVVLQAQEMVRDVKTFTLQYHVANATSFVNAASVAATDWAKVDAVRVTIGVVSTDKRAGVGASAVSPILRTTAATIALRNRVTN